MNHSAALNNDRKMTSIFERFLHVWVVLCIIAGILLGKMVSAMTARKQQPGKPFSDDQQRY